MRLFLWECRRVLRSVSYWLFVAVLVLFLSSQEALPVAETGGAFVRPRPGDEQNVLVPSGDESLIMTEASARLLDAWQLNQFTTYPPPLTIYRQVTLNEQKHARLGGILSDLYGMDAAELAQTAGYAYQPMELTADEDGNLVMPPLPSETDFAAPPALREDLTYEEFYEAMGAVDRLLGGGSDWAVAELALKYGKVPATYEEVLAEYEAGMLHDRYTGAYARLFCDYAVIALALFGALPAVALFLQDFGTRRAVSAVVWARRADSAVLVGTRCAALAVLQFLPVLVMDAALTMYYAGIYGWERIAVGAFLRYSVVWLLPTLMFMVAAGAFVTLATGTAVGVAILPALAWASVTAGVTGLSNGSTYGSLLTPRHNALGKFLVYQQNLPALLWGRGTAVAVAVVLLAAADWVLRHRRKGAALWRV